MCELRIQIPRLLSRKQILQGKGLGTYIITNDPDLSDSLETVLSKPDRLPPLCMTCGFLHVRGKEATCSAGDGRCRFSPWVGKVPWRRK